MLTRICIFSCNNPLCINFSAFFLSVNDLNVTINLVFLTNNEFCHVNVIDLEILKCQIVLCTSYCIIRNLKGYIEYYSIVFCYHIICNSIICASKNQFSCIVLKAKCCISITSFSALDSRTCILTHIHNVAVQSSYIASYSYRNCYCSASLTFYLANDPLRIDFLAARLSIGLCFGSNNLNPAVNLVFIADNQLCHIDVINQQILKCQIILCTSCCIIRNLKGYIEYNAAVICNYILRKSIVCTCKFQFICIVNKAKCCISIACFSALDGRTCILTHIHDIAVQTCGITLYSNRNCYLCTGLSLNSTNDPLRINCNVIGICSRLCLGFSLRFCFRFCLRFCLNFTVDCDGTCYQLRICLFLV